MRFFVFLALLFLLGCGFEHPSSKMHKKLYEDGEIVVFKKTGEKVRIMSSWHSLSTGGFSGEYTVRFSDGAELKVEQISLTEAK